MGQAAVDLPDPLDQQPPTANPGGVDDLLSQLAGDEIDRLLAEADEEAAPSLKAMTAIDAPVEPIQFDDEPAPTPTAAPKLSPNSPLAKLNALADLPPEPAAGAVPPVGSGISVADEASMTLDAETQASLDALSSELGIPPEPVSTVQSNVIPPGAVERILADEAAGLLGTKTPVSAAAAPAPLSPPPSSDEFGTTAGERGALSADVEAELAEAAALKKPLATQPAAAPAPAPQPAAPTHITSNDLNAVLGYGNDEAPLPIVLRPLEWINAPLEACSPTVRDVIGRAAILTLVNAVAVLAYVAFFRR